MFAVTVSYTGRPGVHNDGDGTTEGWFRAPDGGFVTTEPVGSEDWMPLNDYPAAKPTYDFSDTVTAGRTVLALTDGSFVLAPALVLVALDAETPAWSHWPAYVAALAAQFAFDSARDTARAYLGGLMPFLSATTIRTQRFLISRTYR